MLKKTILPLLIFILSFSYIAQAQFFTDTPFTHEHSKAIEYVREQGIVQGYDDRTFRPNNPINRAEFLKILLESDSQSTNNCTQNTKSFPDVQSTDWFFQYVQDATSCSIIEGYPDKTFKPGNEITYSEAAKIVVKTLFRQDSDKYNSPTSTWYEPYTTYLSNLKAYPRQDMQPADLITRAEMSEIIFQIQTKQRLNNSSSELTQQPANTNSQGDITNLTLSSTSPKCSDYTGTYTSNIIDETNGQNLQGQFTITTNSNNCVLTSNQIPNHNTGQDSRFTTTIQENNLNVTIPTNPTLAPNPTTLTMEAPVILLNGIKWEPYPAACFGIGNEPLGREAIGCHNSEINNPWRYNIGSSLNNFGFDIYKAHLQPNGLYHYHSTPEVLYDTECEGKEISPVIGFALDGFPVYGPCFQDSNGNIRKAQSSFQIKSGQRQDVSGYTTPYKVGNVKSDNYDGQFIGDHQFIQGSGDLDQCNGMAVNGQYGYYLTDNYPYVLSCLSGN